MGGSTAWWNEHQERSCMDSLFYSVFRPIDKVYLNLFTGLQWAVSGNSWLLFWGERCRQPCSCLHGCRAQFKEPNQDVPGIFWNQNSFSRWAVSHVLGSRVSHWILWVKGIILSLWEFSLSHTWFQYALNFGVGHRLDRWQGVSQPETCGHARWEQHRECVCPGERDLFHFGCAACYENSPKQHGQFWCRSKVEIPLGEST